MSMIEQILPFVCPGFFDIIEMTNHFFPDTIREEIIRDALKELEVVQTIFKQIPHFFTSSPSNCIFAG